MQNCCKTYSTKIWLNSIDIDIPTCDTNRKSYFSVNSSILAF